MNYRNRARKHLESAEDELRSADDMRLKYAALELRMAMEALTYDRALAYKDEFPPEEYETWQPRKVMSVLLEIDPSADKDNAITIGLEQEYGVSPAEMTDLGSEKVLDMGSLRKHYDALGSYLHIQSMKQARSGKAVDLQRIRARCDEIGRFLREVLASPVFNITFGCFASLNCVECGHTLRKRLPQGQKEVVARCYECQATYTIVDLGSGRIEWQPHQHEVACGGDGCGQRIVVWRHDLKAGRYWKCKSCGGTNTFVIGVRYDGNPG